MRECKLVDLLGADKKNEEVKTGKKGAFVTFMASLLLIAAGYLTVFQWSGRELVNSVVVGSLLVSAGTVLLFLSVSGTVIELLKKRKRSYYRGLNLFVVNQLGSRMKSAGLSISAVCILMFLSVSVMGIGMGLGESAAVGMNETAPYDVTISYYYNGSRDEPVKKDGILGVFAENGGEIPSVLGKSEEITIYRMDGAVINDISVYSAENGDYILNMLDAGGLDLMSVEDFNKIRALRGEEPIELGEQEYAIAYNAPEIKDTVNSYRDRNHQIELYGRMLTLKSGGVYEITLYNRNRMLDYGTLIVPQSVAVQGMPYARILNAMYAGDAEDGYGAVRSDMLRITDFDYNSQKDIYVEILSDKLTASYIGCYLGITFLVTAGAVLALQQLTQSADNRKRYDLLYKMGAGETAMKKSLLTQMKVYFGLPFVIAAAHSGVIMYGIYRIIPYLSKADIARNVLLSAGLAVILYSIYFMSTYSESKKILRL